MKSTSVSVFSTDEPDLLVVCMNMSLQTQRLGRKLEHKHMTSSSVEDAPSSIEIMRDRLRLGMCPMCGMQTYKVRGGWSWTGRSKAMTPITMPGLVLDGRCLCCYPLQRLSRTGAEIQDTMEHSSTKTGCSVDSADVAAGRQTTQKSPVLLAAIRDSKERLFVGEVLEGNSEKGRGIFSHIYREGGFKGKALVYEGEFDGGFFQGRGIFRGASGDVYQGEFNKSEFDGQGEVTFSCGKFYEGSWQNGRREGYGTMKWPNGDIFVGEWKSDRRNGMGEMRYCYGDVYLGSWKNDKRDGVGEKRYLNGGVQKGEWQDGDFLH